MTSRPHGTRARYVADGCRCDPCTAANAEYENTRHRLQTYGRWQPYVDAEPVRQHVRKLQAHGLGWRRLAAETGVSPGVIRNLIYGKPSRGAPPSRRMRRAAADKLLAARATLDNIGDRTWDDDAIDDPAARPDGYKALRVDATHCDACGGRLVVRGNEKRCPPCRGPSPPAGTCADGGGLAMPRPPLPPPPNPNRAAHTRLRAACWRGEAPADALDPADRDELVQALVDARFTVAEIAAHTHMTTYTASRIVERLKRHAETRGLTR